MRWIWIPLLCCTSVFGEEVIASEDEPCPKEEMIAVFLTSGDAVPEDVKSATDPYFEGYLQALVDMHYSEYGVIVLVKKKKVWLANLPKNSMIAKSIIQFVKDVPGVQEVYALEGVPPQEEELREKYVRRPQTTGIWFPQMTELFQPCVADPRNVTYILGYRAGDRVIGKQAVNIALGDDFAIYRWIDVMYGGDLQIGIEAGIWSVFNLYPHPDIAGGTELVNTDFYVGIPITYARDKWSFRFRVYHISSHLGDEYMVNNPTVKRRNPSNEYLDLYAAYQITDALRFYVGPGVIVHSDPSFPWQPMFINYGVEARFLGYRFYYQKVYGTLFFAMHFRNLQQLDWNFDGTFRLGWEMSKLQGIGRKMRLFVGYHDGYSLEGQFQKKKTNYWEFDLNYGF